jgi:hypothetical protein
VNEQHDIVYDNNSEIISGKSRHRQVQISTARWYGLSSTADGGDVVVDNHGGGNSLRYTSTQNLGGFIRRTFDAANTPGPTANPTLTLAGAGPVAQAAPQFKFVTPLAVNNVVANRLIIGGVNGAFESNDNGDNITRITTGEVNGQNGATGSTGNAIAYGGQPNGVATNDVLTSAQALRFWRVPPPPGAVRDLGLALRRWRWLITDVEMDPDDWARVFAIDNNQVFFSPDAGANWNEITGNLTDVNLRTLEYIPVAGGNDIVLAGGNLGVFRMFINNPGVWAEAGVNLPNSPVWDMDYDAPGGTGDDFLVLGTLGRGAWTLANASVALATVPILEICGDEDFANQDDTIRLVRNAGNPSMLDVFLNNNTSVPTAQFPLSSIQQINIFAAGGNDTLIVDSTNGLIFVPGGIRYDGDNGCPGQVGPASAGSTGSISCRPAATNATAIRSWQRGSDGTIAGQDNGLNRAGSISRHRPPDNVAAVDFAICDGSASPSNRQHDHL